MRLLKGFLLTIAGLFAVITLVSLLMPSHVTTARTINISARSVDIMKQVNDLNKWQNWHPLFTGQKIDVSQRDTSQMAEWNSNGKKNQLVIKNVSPDEVRFVYLRTGENQQENKITLIQYKDSNNVQVEWSALTHLKWYPWEKFSGIFIDKMTGSGYEAALTSLKNTVESPSPEN